MCEWFVTSNFNSYLVVTVHGRKTKGANKEPKKSTGIAATNLMLAEKGPSDSAQIAVS